MFHATYIVIIITLTLWSMSKNVTIALCCKYFDGFRWTIEGQCCFDFILCTAQQIFFLFEKNFMSSNSSVHISNFASWIHTVQIIDIYPHFQTTEKLFTLFLLLQIDSNFLYCIYIFKATMEFHRVLRLCDYCGSNFHSLKINGN